MSLCPTSLGSCKKGDPQREGQGPKAEATLCSKSPVPGLLLHCESLYGFVLPESSGWKHHVQEGWGWQSQTHHAIISWLFQR